MSRRYGGAGIRRELRAPQMVGAGGAPASNDPPGSPIAWFDPTRGLMAGTGYSAWTDQIGGYSIGNVVGSEQPTATTVAGRAALAFASASSQKLYGAPTLAGLLGGTAAYTVAMRLQVASYSGATSTFASLSAASGVSDRLIFHGRNSTTPADRVIRRATVPGGTVNGLNDPPTGVPFIHVVSHAGGGIYSSWIDGTISVNAGDTGIPDPGAMDELCLASMRYLGGFFNPLNGAVGDVVIYGAGAPTNTEIEDWFASL